MRVGVAAQHIDPQGGFAAVGAEPARHVRHAAAREPADDPRTERLQAFLDEPELLMLPDTAVADHHLGLVGQDRPDQPLDAVAAILVVGVGVDDDVGAVRERGFQPGAERRRQPLIAAEIDDVRDAVRAGHLDGAVLRPVVDDQHLNGIDAVDPARQIAQRRRQRRLLIVTGDLDDEFHSQRTARRGGRRRRPRSHRSSRLPRVMGRPRRR
ncbi:MAG: hypothetical protein BWZ08_01743 [candidate division BRC1 bacterium ADurb.BinA292]|nr:MAG: hypothetical protein BWZ08_01743 [candidate division BRC1 bacterium ADurb.BinA292]